MSEQVRRIKSRVINKHETEANWKKAVNFIPEQAEHIVYDIDETHDYERLKIGDGITPVNDLPFIDETLIISSTNVVHGEDNELLATLIDTYIKNGGNTSSSFDWTDIENAPIFDITINRETGKIDQSLDEIINASRDGKVLYYVGSLSALTSTHKENNTMTCIELTLFVPPNTILPVKIYADGSFEQENSDNMQMKSDRVEIISDESRHDQYPSAKAVYDAIQNVDWLDIQNKPGDESQTKEVVFDCSILSPDYDSELNAFVYENGDLNERHISVGDIIDIEFIENGNSEPTIYNNIEVLNYNDECAVIINSTIKDIDEIISNGGIVKEDITSVAFIIVVGSDSFTVILSENYTNLNIRFLKKSSTITYNKLPNEALTFDEEPMENSENLVTSGSIYKALQNVGGTGGGTLVQLITWEEND